MTAAGLVRLCLIGFAIAATLLALDFLKEAAEAAFQEYGPAVWRSGTAFVAAAATALVAAVVFYMPQFLIGLFVPHGADLDYGTDYGRWKALGLMAAGGLVALPAIDRLVFALVDGRVLDTAQALIELSLAIVLVVGPGACRRLIFRFVAHR